MKPAFVRFPGGCYVEGDKLEFAFRWKQTIGDLAAAAGPLEPLGLPLDRRPGLPRVPPDVRGPGAEPLFVINCGMAHKDHVPMDQMGQWVQDALDAIEYANGPADSKWGALRAKARPSGAVQPEILEIGNENGGPLYQERYRLFYDAIKAKYPEMHLVANVPDRPAADRDRRRALLQQPRVLHRPTRASTTSTTATARRSTWASTR